MTLDLILFLILALVAVVSALSMLLSRNAIYSALFLILNFVTIAVFYLLLGAPFLAMVQVTVYAGAIMVLFLFVIMLLGVKRLRQSQTLKWQQPVAIALGVVLLAEVAFTIFFRAGQDEALIPFASLSSATGNPISVAGVLFNNYLLPFEITSVLLLVAMIGAIVLTKNEKK